MPTETAPANLNTQDLCVSQRNDLKKDKEKENAHAN